MLYKFQKENIKIATSNAMQKLKSSGKIYTSNPPYGKKECNGVYVDNTEEVKNIDIIKQYKKDGVSIRGTIKLLNERGIKTRKGTKWYYRMVWNILKIDKERKRRFVAKRRRTDKIKIREWFAEYKMNCECVECGDLRWPVLDFHHRDPKTKIDSVARMVQYNRGKDAILKEIAKCDVLCSNCHRIHHWMMKNKI